MDFAKKNAIVNRVSSDFVFLDIQGSIYKYTHPNQEKKALAELVYQKSLESNKYEGFFTSEQLKDILQTKGIWTQQDEAQQENLLKYLEDLKMQLYNSAYDTRQQKTLRRQIESIKTRINKNSVRKGSLDSTTIEYIAEKERQEFLTAICITDSHGRDVYTYENYQNTGKSILYRFLNNAIKNILKLEEYREVARTEPFRSLWAISKENLFNKSSCDLSLDQRTLILYSRMYDNVYENPERPSEEIIADDDMLDGWFASERRKADKERKQSEVDKITRKADDGKGGELFIMTSSKEDAEKIRELNDLGSQMKMKQRREAVQKHGKLEEHQLPDVKLELQNEAMRQMADRFKRK